MEIAKIDPVGSSARILVVIACYGSRNDQYLSRLIDEYRSMPYAVDIVVLSNIHKNLGPDIRVVVGLPTSDPWSLPFGHKQIFADRISEYDFFVYSEDDTLITHRNIDAFVRVSAVLPDDEVAGFLRFEQDDNGAISYPDVHGNYHWEARSVRSRGDYRFAFFTNEHAACFILSRAQLRRAIESGGFLVNPHQGKYDLLCSAATDPYTGCGLTKLICISHLSDFEVHHLPNKYVGKLGLAKLHFDCQIRTLLQIPAEGNTPAPLLEEHSAFKANRFGKNYYEPIRTDLVSLIPAKARSVLSIGCGWGATEETLSRSGKRVVGIPLDLVISACAQAKGVEIVQSDLNAALSELSGSTFDCLLISNVLHLVQNPCNLLQTFVPLLSRDALVIVAVPNLVQIRVLWRKLRGDASYRFLGDYTRSGVHLTSRGIVREWLKRSGMQVSRFVDVIPRPARTLCRRTLGLMTPLVSSEIVAVACKSVTFEGPLRA